MFVGTVTGIHNKASVLNRSSKLVTSIPQDGGFSVPYISYFFMYI